MKEIREYEKMTQYIHLNSLVKLKSEKQKLKFY